MADTSGHQMMAWAYDLFQRIYSEAPYRLSPSGKALPAWHYFIEVTRRCNLRCRMCQYLSYLENVPVSEQKKGELSLDEWKAVVDQTNRLGLITFTGGEPLVRSDFFELLAYASKKRRTHFISNATMLNEEAVEKCMRLAPRRLGGKGLNAIGVSLEGPQEFHDTIRHQQGAFEKSMRGLTLLAEARKEAGKSCPVVHITTVIQEANVSVLAQMPALAASIGAASLNMVTETRLHDLPKVGEEAPGKWSASDLEWPRINREALEQALAETDEEARKHQVDIRWPRMPREELLRYYDGGVAVEDYTCRSPWNTLIIGRTGDVFPCWLQKIGNVREETLAAMWNGAGSRAFRRACRKGLFPVCPGCCFIEYNR
ncbi:MAG: radical SAM protein [Candidatus Hydrogenedens sp.]|jgi:MoaA/NifB/PqqE/SkfB family radical SAM enzyme|nr:radical SAM protein [Candidatus Hydrogenedens sp.]